MALQQRHHHLSPLANLANSIRRMRSSSWRTSVVVLEPRRLKKQPKLSCSKRCSTCSISWRRSAAIWRDFSRQSRPGNLAMRFRVVSSLSQELGFLAKVPQDADHAQKDPRRRRRSGAGPRAGDPGRIGGGFRCTLPLPEPRPLDSRPVPGSHAPPLPNGGDGQYPAASMENSRSRPCVWLMPHSPPYSRV